MSKPVCKMTLKELVEYLYSLQETVDTPFLRQGGHVEERMVLRNNGIIPISMEHDTFLRAILEAGVSPICPN